MTLPYLFDIRRFCTKTPRKTRMSITLPDIPISLTETTTNNPTPTLTEQETVQKMITEMMSAQGPIPQFSDFATTPNANPWQNEETSEESEEHDEATSTTEPITQ